MTWPPHITVACIIEQNRRFLMVEEMSQGRLVYNQPAGHLEPGETLQQAAVREAYEETGWHVQPSHVLGVSKYRAPNDTLYYRTTFIATAIKQDPEAVLDDGIEQALWLSYDQLRDNIEKLRSPLVLKNIEQYLAGQRFPLTLIDDHE